MLYLGGENKRHVEASLERTGAILPCICHPPVYLLCDVPTSIALLLYFVDTQLLSVAERRVVFLGKSPARLVSKYSKKTTRRFGRSLDRFVSPQAPSSYFSRGGSTETAVEALVPYVHASSVGGGPADSTLHTAVGPFGCCFPQPTHPANLITYMYISRRNFCLQCPGPLWWRHLGGPPR